MVQGKCKEMFPEWVIDYLTHCQKCGARYSPAQLDSDGPLGMCWDCGDRMQAALTRQQQSGNGTIIVPIERHP